MPRPQPYDVGLSHASEDRDYVIEVQNALEDRGIRTWCYEFDRSRAVGRRIAEYLDDQVALCDRLFVPFLSTAYLSKVWPLHELRAAQERPFRGRETFVFPVRFPGADTEALMPGVVCEEAHEPEELAERIAERLSEPEAHATHWFEPLAVGGGPGLRLFQQLPVVGRAAPLDEYARACVESLLATVVVESDTAWWTVGEDRVFDRVYATSAALTALRQAQLGSGCSTIARAERFIAGFDVEHIDNRAAAMYRIAVDAITTNETSRFVAMLRQWQKGPAPEPAWSGSFVLEQGPAGDQDPAGPWSAAQRHYGGASFHACHIADALLHLATRHDIARTLAEPILDGVRSFLTRSLSRNGGWLVGEGDARLPLTAYAYALLPRLGLEMLPGWRDIVRQAFDLGVQHERPLPQALAPINMAYVYATTNSAALRRSILPDVIEHAVRFTSVRPPERMSTIDTAIFLRAALSSAWLIDPMLYTKVCFAVQEAVR